MLVETARSRCNSVGMVLALVLVLMLGVGVGVGLNARCQRCTTAYLSTLQT